MYGIALGLLLLLPHTSPPPRREDPTRSDTFEWLVMQVECNYAGLAATLAVAGRVSLTPAARAAPVVRQRSLRKSHGDSRRTPSGPSDAYGCTAPFAPPIVCSAIHSYSRFIRSTW
jgi:hypothetical protein